MLLWLNKRVYIAQAFDFVTKSDEPVRKSFSALSAIGKTPEGKVRGSMREGSVYGKLHSEGSEID